MVMPLGAIPVRHPVPISHDIMMPSGSRHGNRISTPLRPSPQIDPILLDASESPVNHRRRRSPSASPSLPHSVAPAVWNGHAFADTIANEFGFDAQDASFRPLMHGLIKVSRHLIRYSFFLIASMERRWDMAQRDHWSRCSHFY
jgi:hypothetical protein